MSWLIFLITLQYFSIFISSNGASTSSKTQIGEGFWRKTAKIKAVAAIVFSPPDNNDKVFIFFPGGDAKTSKPANKGSDEPTILRKALPPSKNCVNKFLKFWLIPSIHLLIFSLPSLFILVIVSLNFKIAFSTSILLLTIFSIFLLVSIASFSAVKFIGPILSNFLFSTFRSFCNMPLAGKSWTLIFSSFKFSSFNFKLKLFSLSWYALSKSFFKYSKSVSNLVFSSWLSIFLSEFIFIFLSISLVWFGSIVISFSNWLIFISNSTFLLFNSSGLASKFINSLFVNFSLSTSSSRCFFASSILLLHLACSSSKSKILSKLVNFEKLFFISVKEENTLLIFSEIISKVFFIGFINSLFLLLNSFIFIFNSLDLDIINSIFFSSFSISFFNSIKFSLFVFLSLLEIFISSSFVSLKIFFCSLDKEKFASSKNFFSLIISSFNWLKRFLRLSFWIEILFISSKFFCFFIKKFCFSFFNSFNSLFFSLFLFKNLFFSFL